MNKNLTNEEFVNKYLDNELSEVDRLNFEDKLLHDSEIRKEYDFQKDLVQGIKEVRRLELKSRLANIPINTPLYQTVAFKAIAVASISVSIGLGAYYLLNDNSDEQLSDIDLKDNTTITLSEKSLIPEIPDAITPIIKEDVKEPKRRKVKKQEKTNPEAVAKNTEVKVEPKIIQPNVIQPDVVEAFEEEDIESKDISLDNQINNLDNIKENVESTVEISTVKDKRNKFHYKFFENKLFLLGDFSDMPYEIIELNSSSGKSYFLFYNDSFYKLDTEQLKPAPLVKIESDSLVNELKIIQLNQSN